jgi:hypothetical protein
MPVYLVRWPDLCASLVRARDEDDLVDILDQVANPDGCEWSVYEGPLFIDFRLPVEWDIRDDRNDSPISPEQVVIEDVGPLAYTHVFDAMELSLANGDDGSATAEAIVHGAFPEVHAAIERLFDSDERADREGVLPEPDLKKALHAELSRLLGWSWRDAQLQRKTDPVSKLMKEMDLPLRLAQRHFQDAQPDSPVDDDDPEPPKDDK